MFLYSMNCLYDGQGFSAGRHRANQHILDRKYSVPTYVEAGMPNLAAPLREVPPLESATAISLIGLSESLESAGEALLYFISTRRHLH